MSPALITSLLDIYTDPEPIVTQGVKDELNNMGLVEYHSDKGRMEVSEMGRAMIQSLINVPLPRKAFIDEHGRVL